MQAGSGTVSTDIQAQSRSFGTAGILVGLFALMTVLLPPLLAPVPAPAPQTETASTGKPHPLKERVLEKLKLASPKKEEPKAALSGSPQYLQTAATALALFAIVFASVALIRREERIYAGIAAALGIGTLALQLALLFAGVLIAVLGLSAVLGQTAEVYPPRTIAAGAILILAAVALPAFGVVSPWLVVLVIAVGIAILGLSSLVGGFW
jgi:hypothetical protein